MLQRLCEGTPSDIVAVESGIISLWSRRRQESGNNGESRYSESIFDGTNIGHANRCLVSKIPMYPNMILSPGHARLIGFYCRRQRTMSQLGMSPPL